VVINLLTLYEYINTKLTPLSIPFYADEYPKDLSENKVYPYVVFYFSNTSTENYADLNLLQIDIWNNKSTPQEIETIADSIDNIFKNLIEDNENMFIKIYRNKPYHLKLDELNNGIQRRQLRYLAKAYYK
jgi:type I restriction-modification system DNA methylase subunit